MSNVKLFRLLNGEEILGEVVCEGMTSVTIKNPVKVMIIPSKADPKVPTIGFAPWCEFTDDKEIVLKEKHILITMNPINEFLNQYNQIFGKLVVPNSTKLLLPNG